MMSNLEEAASAFLDSLQQLTFNSKPIITMLTMIASEMGEQFEEEGPRKVVELICKKVFDVEDNEKLPVLYLMDSICKNIREPYIKLFESRLVNTFIHVFEHSDEAVRLSLHKLRTTWNGIFSEEVLLAIDIAVRSIDPAWPANNSSASTSNSAKRKKDISEPTSSGLSSKRRAAVNNASHPGLPASSSRRKQITKPTVPSKRKVTISEPPSLNSASNISSLKLPLSSLGTQDRDYRKELIPDKKHNDGVINYQEHADVMKSVDQSGITGNSNLDAFSIKQQIDPLVGVSRLNSVPAIGALTASPSSTLDHIPAVAAIPGPNSFISSPSLHATHSDFSKDIDQVQVDGNTVKLFFLDENTSIVLMKGSHLSLNELVNTNPFALEPRLIMFEGRPTKVYIDSDKGSNDNLLLDFNAPPITFFHKDHAQRIKLGGPCREIILNGEHYKASFGGPPVEVKFAGAECESHTLRLGGPPPRVRISEEIRFDLWSEYAKKIRPSTEYPLSGLQTSYSSLNSQPSTSYPTPSVLGTASLLPQPNAVVTPGTLVQPQMTSSVIPPVQLPIPPGCLSTSAAVPTPLTSLPANLQASAMVNNVPAAYNPSDGQAIPMDRLLDNLISLGLIKKTESPDPTTNTITTASSSNHSVINSSGPALPIVSTTESISSSINSSSGTSSSSNTKNHHHRHHRSRSPNTPSNRENGLKALQEIDSEPLVLETKSLKADHPKVIADLINGTQCVNCSLRFEVGDSSERSKYSAHLDWHFRLNRQERSNSKSKSATVRRWFCPLDLWVTFKEITDETDEMISDSVKKDQDSDGEKKIHTVSANEDESLNECAVCKEKFETTWNEDEEEWQLLNAVKGQDDRVYHPLCLEDLLRQEAEAAAAAVKAAQAAAQAEIAAEDVKTEVKTMNGDNNDKENQESAMETGQDTSGDNGQSSKESEIKEETESDPSSGVNSGSKRKSSLLQSISNNLNTDGMDDKEGGEDEEMKMIDEGFTLFPGETPDQFEVSVCSIC